MSSRLLYPLTIALCIACSPTADDDSDNKGGSGGKTGGSAGSSAGSGGSAGGAGGSAAGSGGQSGGAGGGGGAVGGGGGAMGGAGGMAMGDAGSAMGGAGGAMGGAGGAMGGAGGMDAGANQSPAAEIESFVFDVPCPPGTVRPAGNCNVPNADDRRKSVMKMFGGDPNVTYKVRMKICAVSEERGYTGCMSSPDSNYVCINGTPAGGSATYPTLSMIVSEPMRTYHLNSGNKRDDLSKIEYTATFDIKGGATLTFDTNGGSNGDVYTAKFRNHNFECPGAPGIMQPFEGQFLWVQVESVMPAM